MIGGGCNALYDNGMSGDGKDVLLMPYVCPQSLYLDHNQIHDVLPVWFGTGCLQLQLLSLANNQFTGALFRG